MRYLDLFTGYGGFSLGIRQAGLKIFPTDKYLGNPISCVGFAEIDKHASAVLRYRFPNIKNYGDITKIRTDELPDFDLLTGGFPCQAFSIAGKRMGFSDTRGTLFFEIARILKDKKPKFLLLENVKGLLSHDNQRTFETILCTLSELGYGVEWQICNSKSFGVPQNRERVFIFGTRGECPGKVFPIGEDDGAVTELQGQPCTNTLTARYEGAQATGSYIIESKLDAQIRQLNNPTHSNDRVYSDEGISPTLNTMQGGNRQPFVAIPVLTPDRPEKRQNGRRFKEDGEPSFTLTAQDKHGVMLGKRIRRLTPTECMRLQGVPDDWCDYGIDEKGRQYELSDSAKYKLAGNGVTVNVVEAIIGKIIPLCP